MFELAIFILVLGVIYLLYKLRKFQKEIKDLQAEKSNESEIVIDRGMRMPMSPQIISVGMGPFDSFFPPRQVSPKVTELENELDRIHDLLEFDAQKKLSNEERVKLRSQYSTTLRQFVEALSFSDQADTSLSANQTSKS